MTLHADHRSRHSASPPPMEPHDAAFAATEMAEHLLALVRADPTVDLAGDVNPGAFAGFFVARGGRRYYVRVEEILSLMSPHNSRRDATDLHRLP